MEWTMMGEEATVESIKPLGCENGEQLSLRYPYSFTRSKCEKGAKPASQGKQEGS
jgi:hypothetical protein